MRLTLRTLLAYLDNLLEPADMTAMVGPQLGVIRQDPSQLLACSEREDRPPGAIRARELRLDHRGHGQGIKSRSSFRLEDCADDVVALADTLGINTFIPVGYSMGGTIAQLIWKQHVHRVSGLVLCSTAPIFAKSREERLGFLGLTGLVGIGANELRRRMRR